ncbi:MAG: HD domain-containing protein [Sphaerochaetaceae bacterium]
MNSNFVNEIAQEKLKSRQIHRKEDVRGAYYRDTTAVLHCSAFRRLKHKTQVFFAPSNDHICTRIEHSLHVSSIAQTICHGLNLDVELAEAIGLSHDLGHTPFGHLGEKIISDMMEEKGLGKFEHEINSLRIVDFISKLNLTYAVRDGIVCHCGEKLSQSIKPTNQIKDLGKIKTKSNLIPSTWEGCVVRFSDQVAYLGRDWEDAVRLNIIEPNSIPKQISEVLGSNNAEIINTLVTDIIDNSDGIKGISFSNEVYEALKEMMSFNYKEIYKSEILAGYSRYFERLIHLVYDYLDDLLTTYGMNRGGYLKEKNMLATAFYNNLAQKREDYIEHDGSLDKLVFDYIAGMSDNFCLDCVNEILIPNHINDSIELSLTGKWFDAPKK